MNRAWGTRRALARKIEHIRISDGFMLLIVVGIIPNLFFLGASPFFLVERMISPLLYVLAALAMIFAIPAIGWIAFAAAAAIDLGLIVCHAFHLPLPLAIDSIRYMGSIDIFSSIVYVAVLATVIATTALSAGLTQHFRHRFRAASPTPVVLLALALLIYDRAYVFPNFKIEQERFDSARMQTRLTDETIAAGGKNLLVVMVEGLGAFTEPADRALFERAIASGLPEGRFEFSTGTTAYMGSTTAATARELCSEWSDALGYLDGQSHECLPRSLAMAGYETVAYHGFSADMFRRDQWYPNIGFTELNFPARLLREHGGQLDERCGSVFQGLCDDQLGGIVHSRLLASRDSPKFIYWLTLNSHVPYVPQRNGKLGCASATPRIDNRTVCELSEIWLAVFDRVNRIASDPELPPTDILVVGDHHTPLWQRSARAKFIPGRVDWYLLADRRETGRI